MKHINKTAILLMFGLWFAFLNSSAEQNKNTSNVVDSLVSALNQPKHDTLQIQLLQQLSTLQRSSNPEKAIDYAKQAYELAHKSKNQKLMAGSLKCMGNVWLVQGDFAKGIEEYKKSLKIQEDIQDMSGMASSLNNIGVSYRAMGQLDSALLMHKKCLIIDRKRNDKSGIAYSLGNIASVYKLKGDFEACLDFSLQSLKIFEELDDEDATGSCMGNIASLYKELGNLNSSKEYYLKAIAVFEKTGNKYTLAKSYNNFANLLGVMNERETALSYMKQAITIGKEIGDKQGLGSSYVNLATIYSKSRNEEQALKYYLLAISMFDETGDENAKGVAYAQIGNYYQEFENHKQALVYLQKGLEILIKVGNKSQIKDTYKAIAHCNSQLKDYKKAYEYHQLFSQSKDSIISEEKNKQIAEMQTKYETEKKQKENEILTKENEIKTLEINQQKNQRTVLIGVFGFILLIGFLIFNRQRLKQKNKILVEKELRASAVFQAQEKEKVHLSKELHDGLGPLLSLIKLNVSSLETNSGNQKMISEIKDLASEGMKEVRTISHALMPSLLEKNGLEAALKEFAEQINQTQILKTELIFSISTRFSKETEVNIYRIAQETVNNILKHAEATLATIQLKEKDKQLELIISDNGKGFDITKAATGNGLNNIYSRVDFLKGKIQVKSSPATGTVFTIFIPVKVLQYA